MKLIVFTLLYFVMVGQTLMNCDRYTTPGSQLRRTMTCTSNTTTKKRTSEFHVLLTLMKLQCFWVDVELQVIKKHKALGENNFSNSIWLMEKSAGDGC